MTTNTDTILAILEHAFEALREPDIEERREIDDADYLPYDGEDMRQKFLEEGREP